MNLSLIRRNLLLWSVSSLKLPLLFYIRPRVVQYDEQVCRIQVKLNRRSRNHVGSMYFGALAMGAELSIAAAAVFQIFATRKKVEFIFKSFKCDFLKRADADVIFVSELNEHVEALVQRAIRGQGQRVEETFTGYAVTVKNPQEKIMLYQLTLSMKLRSS